MSRKNHEATSGCEERQEPGLEREIPAAEAVICSLSEPSSE